MAVGWWSRVPYSVALLVARGSTVEECLTDSDVEMVDVFCLLAGLN